MNTDKHGFGFFSKTRQYKTKENRWTQMNTDKHTAAKPQIKEITPSLPSPLEGEG
jgi:hypothetical protein